MRAQPLTGEAEPVAAHRDLPTQTPPEGPQPQPALPGGGEWVGSAPVPGQPRVFVARSVARFVLQQARHRQRSGRACAGLLVGWSTVEGETPCTVVDGAVEAPEVEQASRSVRFSAACWSSLAAVAAAEFAHRDVVGWFHARPGEEATLSPYESFWHQTRFPHPWQLALVADPVEGRLHVTGWVGQALEVLSGFYLCELVPSGLMTAEQVEQAGFYPPPSPQAAAETAAAEAATRRGTWPASPLQERLRARSLPPETRLWIQVGRVVRAVVLLGAVFMAAALARWVWDQGWAWVHAPAVDPYPAGGPAAPAARGESPGGVPGKEPAGASSAGQAAAQPRPQSYVVQPGDTLWGLARRLYGDPRKAAWIARVNNLENPGRILVGQVLRLPPDEGSSQGGK